jgi:hypothetical protein
MSIGRKESSFIGRNILLLIGMKELVEALRGKKELTPPSRSKQYSFITKVVF